ncbi:MAG: hypothetical protein EKK46_17685 [Rhodocyclaceae bacterium]|nr:MAG: hypothetical protein EKK46_17685 [Rhodocyclaceae bacterium]
MVALSRFLLLLLIAIALPLQGLAAATMAVCGGGQSHTMAAGDMSAAHHHGHDPRHQDEDKTSHKTVCVACYAFSLPVSFTLPTPATIAVTPIAAAMPAYIGFEPEGPERPPRTRPV